MILAKHGVGLLEELQSEEGGEAKYDKAIDVWSIGVVAFGASLTLTARGMRELELTARPALRHVPHIAELLSGRLPFRGDSPEKTCERVVYQNVETLMRTELPHYVSDDARTFIASCLTRDVRQRATVEQLLDFVMKQYHNSPSSPMFSGCRALIVEDDPVTQKFHERLLAIMGFKVFVAVDGQVRGCECVTCVALLMFPPPPENCVLQPHFFGSNCQT